MGNEEKILNKELEVKGQNVLKEKNSRSLSFGLKILYILYPLIILSLITYIIMLKNDDTLISKNKNNEFIKTTTVEEMSDLKNGINNIYESTIYIEVSNNRGNIASGSGFIYRKDEKYAYILTNYHVIDGGNKFAISFIDGTSKSAVFVNGDSYYDIAILRIDSKGINSVATMGNSSNLELGDTVFTVGAPLGKDYMGTITKGIVSGTNRMVSVSLTSGSYMMDVIQTDASINSGNSGGPICNIKGEVVGITSSKLVGTGVEGMGFAIPINSVMEIISSIESGKSIERPYLGIQLADLNNAFSLQYYYGITISSDVKFGAVLSYVEKNKPADKAGLKVGDVIIEMDGKKIENVSYFKYLLYKYSIGSEVKIKYYRDNKINETTIKLSEMIKSE